LPPYIARPDTEADTERYQTVYARETGSAAAPTAGLHFTPLLLERLVASGVELAFVTLEVGLGTFLPVRAVNVADHKMHTERYHIGGETAVAFDRARSEGRPILAVGTTSLRTLESAFTPQGLRSGWGSTDIFITPGYQFRAVDQLFTNFHTPESTLLMLVSAFAGQEFLLESYRQAVVERYHFFSYGDAMLIRSRA
jgi:S-adenosylmethionine:tRNA ribosyltransferase-isomerase